MKDSKKYADKLPKTIRTLKRKYGKIEAPKYDLSAQSLVFAILSQHMSENATAANIKKLKDSFVDWNDLRVSRPEEISEVLGKDTAENRKIAEELTINLNAIFNKYDLVNFESLAEVGKRQVKAVLEKLLPANRYVVNYIILTVFDVHAIPLTSTMVEYLKTNDLVHPESTEEEIEGFMERQIPANQAYESYEYLRKEAESTVKKGSAEKTKNNGNTQKTAAKKQ